MRKIKYALLVILSLSYLGSLSAQEVQDPNIIFKSLEKKYKSSEEDIVNPKKMVKASTWVKRGDLLVKAYKVDQEHIRMGMDLTQLKIFYKEPKETVSETIGDKTFDVMVYERVKIYTSQNKVDNWTITNYVGEDPLTQAYDAYKKALEVDPEISSKLSDNLDELNLECQKEASIQFRVKKDYASASKYFALAFETIQLKAEEDRYFDTADIYNAGLAANSAKMYEKSVEYLNKAKEYKYGGDFLYILLKDGYANLNDSAKILDVLKEGFSVYPESKDIVVELTNYYVTTGQTKEALDYLKMAKQKDPENSSYYVVEGQLLDKMGEQPKAIETYKAAINLDGENFIPYYNLGVIYYNRAVEIVKQMNDLGTSKADQAKYDELQPVMIKELVEAVPYMEKGLMIAEKQFTETNSAEAKVNYTSTLETLKTIYFRLRNEDPKYKTRLEEIEAMITKAQ